MWAAIWLFLAGIVVPLATQVLVGIGFGVVAYTGMTFALDAVQAQVFSQFTGLPATIVGIAGIMQVDDAINIIFSALAMRAAMAGWQANQRRTTRFQPWRGSGWSGSTD